MSALFLVSACVSLILTVVSSFSKSTFFGDKPTSVFDQISIDPDFKGCIMTRDHVCLNTDIYLPSSDKIRSDGTFDGVYGQTPYNKENLKTYARQWTDLGYAFIAQEVRGRHGSNGTYSFFRTSGNDSVDTFKWCLKQKEHPTSDDLIKFTNWTGFAGAVGFSADALSQYADIPGVTLGGNFSVDDEVMNHWKVAYLKCGDGLGRQTVFQGGAYREGLISGWLDRVLLEPEMVKTILNNEEFDSFWYTLVGNWTGWNKNNIITPKYGNISQWSIANLSIIHHAGWYDIFSTLQMETAFGVNETSVGINGKSNQILVVEPGGHCEGGAIRWKNSSYADKILNEKYAPNIFAAAFEAARNESLGRSNGVFNVHDYVPFNVLYYMLGPGLKDSIGNYWIQSMGFPVFKDTIYYLDGSKGNDNGTLVIDNSNLNINEDGSNSYTYDPKDPVRTWGGNNLIIQPCGPQSQSKNENGRKDILHYTSDIIKDTFATVGMYYCILYVTSDCVDTDFTAKVIDVFPDGTPMLVQDSIIRMRWRNGEYATQKAENMTQDMVYEVKINIGYMAYVWNEGHQISLSVSSSNYKRFSINYNNGALVKDGDKDGYKIANNTLFFGQTYPSRLILPVVDINLVNKDKVPEISERD